MNKQVIGVIAVVAIALAAVIGIIIATSEEAPAPTSLAVVNDVTIPYDDFGVRVSAFEREYGMGFSPDEREARVNEFKKATLDQIIDTEIARQMVRSSGITVSEEDLDAILADAKAAWGDEETFISALAAQGLTEEDYRAELELQTMLQRYADTLEVEVDRTDDEIRAIYDADRDRFPGTWETEKQRILAMLEISARSELLTQRIAEARSAAKVDILIPELANLYD